MSPPQLANRLFRWPPVDERLAVPETRTEVIDGVVVETTERDPRCAVRHAGVSDVVCGCLAAGYLAAVDMLTRVDATNDRAADVSVFAEGPDEETGGRKLEEITFEVCDSQRTHDVTRKAKKFVDRGVRRVFYVRVDTDDVFEWSRASDTWARLDDDATITDRCFVVPIPVKALLQRVLADDTVAHALLARGNPVVVAAVNAARAAGVKTGRDEGLQPLSHLFARRLGRALTEGEFARLRERLSTLGAARLGDVVLDLAPDALRAWLADDDAR